MQDYHKGKLYVFDLSFDGFHDYKRFNIFMKIGIYRVRTLISMTTKYLLQLASLRDERSMDIFVFEKRYATRAAHIPQ